MYSTDIHRLEVSKALRQLFLLDRSFQLGAWKDEKSRDDWMHDLQVMRQHNDLHGVSLELLGADGAIVFRYRINFDKTDGHGAPPVDRARGIELPVIDRDLIHGNRVLIHGNRNPDAYRHLLRLSWSQAQALPKRLSSGYESEHARKITAGRQSGKFELSNDDRQLLVICRAGARDFAFARAPRLGDAAVHLKAQDAPLGFRFFVGQQVSAFVIRKENGQLQARNILPA